MEIRLNYKIRLTAMIENIDYNSGRKGINSRVAIIYLPLDPDRKVDNNAPYSSNWLVIHSKRVKDSFSLPPFFLDCFRHVRNHLKHVRNARNLYMRV